MAALRRGFKEIVIAGRVKLIENMTATGTTIVIIDRVMARVEGRKTRTNIVKEEDDIMAADEINKKEEEWEFE